jgi:uncharacterized caspase-like protein
MLRAAVIVLLIALWPSHVRAEAKFALLIGNQAYDPSVGILKNPYNDIAVVGQALGRQGFEVLPPIKDARRSTILGGVRQLVQRLNGAGAGAIGFIYYSGHGAAEKDTNINYLIPVDAKEPGTTAFWDESVKLDDVLRLLDGARSAAKFIVFDACRSELQLPTKDTTKGLVPVAEQQGMFIAYASAPGHTASDKGEGSGLYAAALAAELGRPGLDHLNLFQNVKEAVLASTGGVQQPWESNGLGHRIYLTGPPASADPTLPVQPPAPPQAREGPTYEQQAELAIWSAVRESKDPAVLQVYLDKYPRGTFADLARQLIAQAKRESEARQAEAAERAAQAQRAEAERKARDAEAAKQQDQLRQALEEAHQAREALKAAETDRRAAESAAQEARRSAEALAAALPKEVPSPSPATPATSLCIMTGGSGTNYDQGSASHMANAALKNSAIAKFGTDVRIDGATTECEVTGSDWRCTARARACASETDTEASATELPKEAPSLNLTTSCSTAGGWGIGNREEIATLRAQGMLKDFAKSKFGNDVKIEVPTTECEVMGSEWRCTARARACR